MKLITHSHLFIALTLISAHSAVRSEEPLNRSARDLAATESLITATVPTNSLPVSASAHRLLEWPSLETLNSQFAIQDRSKAIPPLFPQKAVDAKPIRLGASTPQAARKEAERWIRRVLKPQWVADDLSARLQPVQREPASESSVVCRYLIEGHAIQINQSRASMWVTIKPPKDKSLSTNEEEIGNAAFNNYFVNGEQMASQSGKKSDGTANLRVWLPDYSAPIPAGALENWWGWRLWLTDGDAVAVFLPKISEDSARNTTPEDPWF